MTRSEMRQIVINIFQRSQGREHSRGIPWVAVFEEEEIALATSGVCFAACRALIKRGIDPNTIVTFYHIGSKTAIFELMTLSQAADLMVIDSDKSIPRIVKYEPFPDLANARE
jgi:hypothetical protein